MPASSPLLRRFLRESDMCTSLPNVTQVLGKSKIEVSLIFLAEMQNMSLLDFASYPHDIYAGAYRTAIDRINQENRAYFSFCVTKGTQRAVHFFHHQDIMILSAICTAINNGQLHSIANFHHKELGQCDDVYQSLLIPDPDYQYALIVNPERISDYNDLLEREMSIFEDNKKNINHYSNPLTLLDDLFISPATTFIASAVPCTSCKISYTPNAKRYPWRFSVCNSSMSITEGGDLPCLSPPYQTVSTTQNGVASMTEQ